MSPAPALLCRVIVVLALVCAAVVRAEAAPPQGSADALVMHLQTRWAEIKYRVPDKAQQAAQLGTLETEAAAAVAQYPASAGLKIWQAIILATDAGLEGGLSGLGKAKEAKALLEAAEAIDPTALAGSVYTSLGSLYYQVPGWPLGFGDNKRADAYLKKALAANPDGIDPNFFYGDYLIYRGRYADAVPVLEKALRAPRRPNRELADAGRRQEVQALLEVARKKSTE